MPVTSGFFLGLSEKEWRWEISRIPDPVPYFPVEYVLCDFFARQVYAEHIAVWCFGWGRTQLMGFANFLAECMKSLYILLNHVLLKAFLKEAS
ncbi:hypothetical protein [Desulfobotulus sp.]|uniref:hypothetical protein n=1 Tax=Desulfobotulus sp. TaxID=1940337 RepID=UPI002A363E27|nr:hypothetical protein [Desulfobotulus sp.]MDY0162394.1 hypothetical protein [Desulfobotulus sp.]